MIPQAPPKSGVKGKKLVVLAAFGMASKDQQDFLRLVIALAAELKELGQIAIVTEEVNFDLLGNARDAHGINYKRFVVYAADPELGMFAVFARIAKEVDGQNLSRNSPTLQFDAVLGEADGLVIIGGPGAYATVYGDILSDALHEGDQKVALVGTFGGEARKMVRHYSTHPHEQVTTVEVSPQLLKAAIGAWYDSQVLPV